MFMYSAIRTSHRRCSLSHVPRASSRRTRSAYGRPQAVDTYVAEITQGHHDKPIKYVIYSHPPFRPYRGRQALQGRGARFLFAQRGRRSVWHVLKDPPTRFFPDETMGRCQAHHHGWRHHA
jgi:hypothetical protein